MANASPFNPASLSLAGHPHPKFSTPNIRSDTASTLISEPDGDGCHTLHELSEGIARAAKKDLPEFISDDPRA